uniref:Uncharacterized protein n=1 Tax=Tolypothrix bouteillei VB521301 TaxID=1479485 RepID=A0A0C1R134_9CYAN
MIVLRVRFGELLSKSIADLNKNYDFKFLKQLLAQAVIDNTFDEFQEFYKGKLVSTLISRLH